MLVQDHMINDGSISKTSVFSSVDGYATCEFDMDMVVSFNVTGEQGANIKTWLTYCI